jgi:hypothetical protein
VDSQCHHWKDDSLFYGGVEVKQVSMQSNALTTSGTQRVNKKNFGWKQRDQIKCLRVVENFARLICTDGPTY